MTARGQVLRELGDGLPPPLTAATSGKGDAKSHCPQPTGPRASGGDGVSSDDTKGRVEL